jgi:hypothetical protein
MDVVPLPVIVLNSKRQVLAANRAMLELLNMAEDDAIGKRTGELIGCTHWAEGPDGCGTARSCATCGAVQAMLECQVQEGTVTRECRVSYDGPDAAQALDLRVTASALELEGERFTVCILEDISDRKRLAVLSRLFFHDVLNTASCIQGCSYLLARLAGEDGDAKEWCQRLSDLTRQLVDDIEAQRDLMYAEAGDLTVRPERVATAPLLDSLRRYYATHLVAEGRQVVVDAVWHGSLTTDPRLLRRILGNMIKNALEATEAGGTVTLSCEETPAEVIFRVHNTAVMPEEVQLQIFQRSFSTKEQPGRGIGTYSMKLLGERYLRGRLTFTSGAPEGTTFTLALPKVLDVSPHAAASAGCVKRTRGNQAGC